MATQQFVKFQACQAKMQKWLKVVIANDSAFMRLVITGMRTTRLKLSE